MHLHWDGNNSSLNERNLSAAFGAGVTPETVDHASIARIADWLKTLPPPARPNSQHSDQTTRGQQVFVRDCAACHGYSDANGYHFEGEYLGKVDPISSVGTDPWRLNSYTTDFRDMQLKRLFAGTPYQFKNFVKTDGYANVPLDGLWLRGPYLHNGSVPTIADLLKPPGDRPAAFLRGSDVIDVENGGFLSPLCKPSVVSEGGFCFDTTQPGNGNGGHLYGTTLNDSEKSDLLAYLKTF
jgi:hypothetical protein